MLFFGWGSKSRTARVSDVQTLILTYSYVHLFWLFQVAFNRRYSVATLTEMGWATRPLSPQEVAAGGAESTLALSWWWRFGLVVALAAVVVAVTLSSLFTS